MSMPPSSIRATASEPSPTVSTWSPLARSPLAEHRRDLRVVLDDQHPCSHLNLRWTIEPPCDSPGRRPSIADGDSAHVPPWTSVVDRIVAATARIVAIIGLVVDGGVGVVIVGDGRGVRSRYRFGGLRTCRFRRRDRSMRRRSSGAGEGVGTGAGDRRWDGRRLGRGRGIGNHGRRCRCRRRRGGGGCRRRCVWRSERRGRPPSSRTGTDGSPSSIGSTGGGGSGTMSVAARTNPPPPRRRSLEPPRTTTGA